MKLPKKFDTFKYKRTYIGGSKKNELQIALKIIGQEKNIDFSKCDWEAMRDFNDKMFPDVIHVIFSWKTLLKEISHVFAFIGLLTILFYNNIPLNKYIFILTTTLSLVFWGGYVYLNNKQKNRTKLYYELLTHTILNIGEKYKITTNI